MDAYYYGFTPTDVEAINRILSAVACAGKAFHHTDGWVDDAFTPEHLRGATPVEWIQNAAIDAATALSTPPPDAQDRARTEEYSDLTHKLAEVIQWAAPWLSPNTRGLIESAVMPTIAAALAQARGAGEGNA